MRVDRVEVNKGTGVEVHVHTGPTLSPAARTKIGTLEEIRSKEIIDFSTERERHVHFFGREDIFEEIDEQLRARPSGWVVLTAGPGMGKSALLERWLTRREEQGLRTAYHFIRRGNLDWADPAAIRANLAAQIEAMFPELCDPQAEPRNRLEALLAKLPASERLALLVDGLDEAMRVGKENPVEQVFPSEVPEGVFVVVASRPRYSFLNWFKQRTGAVHELDLYARSESNEAAVRAYWTTLGPQMEPPLAAALQTAAIENAQGNLIHAVKLREWWTKRGVTRSVDDVPKGLEGTLAGLWDRVEALPKEQRKLVRAGLSLICAARESLPLHMIEELLNWDEGDGKDEFLPAAREMLHKERWEDQHCYRPFHESLREFVERELPRAAKRNAGLLAEFAVWPLEGDEFRRRYALRHRVVHLVEDRQMLEAEVTCLDVRYLTAKACEVGVTQVEFDLRLVTGNVERERDVLPGITRLSILQRALGACSHWAIHTPEALPALLYDRLLTNAPDMFDDLKWPGGFPRLIHPLQTPGLPRTLTDHDGHVNAVVVLSDGRIVSASGDGTLRIWNSDLTRTEATLTGHSGGITSLAVLDMNHVVSGSFDKTLRVWDIELKESVRVLRGHAHQVMTVASFPDGRIVSGSYDGVLHVWDADSSTPSGSLTGHSRAVLSVAVLPGNQVVSASRDNTLRVWDVDTCTCNSIRSGHADSVNAVAALDSGRFVSGSTDGTLRIWELRSNACQTIYTGSIVYDIVAFSNNMIALGTSKGVSVRNARLGNTIAAARAHGRRIAGVAVLDDGRIVGASHDKTLRVWDMKTQQSGACGHTGWVAALAVLPKGRVASASQDRTVRVWDSRSGASYVMPHRHRDEVTTLAALPDGRVVSGSWDNELRIWDAVSRQDFGPLRGHTNAVQAVVGLPDGRIVSASTDNTLRLWDLGSDTSVIFRGHTSPVHAVDVIPGGRQIVSGSWDMTVRVWDIESQKTIHTLKHHKHHVLTVAALPDGRVISGSSDSLLCLWDTDSGALLGEFEGHRARVMDVAILPNGNVISASEDWTLRIWDTRTQKSVAVIYGDCPFWSVAVLAEDEVVAGDLVGNVWFVDLGQMK